MTTDEGIARAVWFLRHSRRWSLRAIADFTDLKAAEILDCLRQGEQIACDDCVKRMCGRELES
jgi:hypothetical protein